jgi:integrative and conjugative element protein (TIGR02256 family)
LETLLISTAKLVIDASTTLEYPRFASSTDSIARHISVFITPNGNSSVLLVEDEKRQIRLRTLEAQYYRALIQEPWGQQHLEDNLSTFWSGASCRDISKVIPYSRIMVQAATLTEQIPMAASQPEARIRIWERAPDQGDISVHDISVFPDFCFEYGTLNLFIDEGAINQLHELRQANLPNETGGILLGYYDFNINAVVVVGGLPAPPDSSSKPNSFERGVDGLVAAVTEASKRTAGIVGYIGEWHTHPHGHSASPSKDDLIQLIHLTLGMDDDGLPGVQLIVGEEDIKVMQGKIK